MTLISQIRETVSANMQSVADLGNWPPYINVEQSLLGRLPSEGAEKAPGFDAGIACCLGLIPQEKQALSAALHAAYTEAAVVQVRNETSEWDADSETTWWLAACSLCLEGQIDETAFLTQVDAFKALAGDPEARLAAAKTCFEEMISSFKLLDGVAFSIKDGGMQGSYIAGHDFAVGYSETFGIFFLGTFRETLGLENFSWSDRTEVVVIDGKEVERPLSGPVHGNRQFVKASSFDELASAVSVVREALGN